MDIHLPEELKRYVQSEVQCGRFASEDEAIQEALRLLKQRSQDLHESTKALTEREFEQKLLQSGFLGSAPPQSPSESGRFPFQPIAIQGELLSETVIRERR